MIHPSESGCVANTVDEAESSILALYRQQYDRLQPEFMARCSWEAIVDRFLMDSRQKLKKAILLRGGGSLVGIDKAGKAMIKDQGTEPVMYGYDKDGILLRSINRDPKTMKKIKEWADYFQVREQVLREGYELFSGSSHFQPAGRDTLGYFLLNEEIKQVEAHTQAPFVASMNKREPRVSWLETGPATFLPRRACFNPNSMGTKIYDDNEELVPLRFSGAIRLLRA